jgi:RNA polymerase sigma factor (sigma-70 family)
MCRAQGGNEEAYVELLVLLTSEARRYVRGKLGAATFVDDVVQDTLVSVHRARHTYNGHRGFSPWFYAIASSRVVDAIRRQRRVGLREVGVDVLPEPAHARPTSEPSVDLDAVHSALARLPPRQREVVESMKLRDERVRDIAARLGMSVPAVKVTAHRGYVALRRLLGVTRDAG